MKLLGFTVGGLAAIVTGWLVLVGAWTKDFDRGRHWE